MNWIGSTSGLYDFDVVKRFNPTGGVGATALDETNEEKLLADLKTVESYMAEPKVQKDLGLLNLWYKKN